MTEPAPRIVPCGDAAILVEFGHRIDDGINRRVIALDKAVGREKLPGVIESVPTYRSLMVHLDPLAADHVHLLAILRRLASETEVFFDAGRRWKVPVLYGGRHGEDLDWLASSRGMSPELFVELHAAPNYRVHMVGFMPGFTYLGGLDPRLATPRRPVPRSVIPGGSISIGGAQSAIGSNPSPSGWHLIGRTPVRCYDPERSPKFLFEAGDEVIFEPIRPGDWDPLAEQAASGHPVAERIG